MWQSREERGIQAHPSWPLGVSRPRRWVTKPRETRELADLALVPNDRLVVFAMHIPLASVLAPDLLDAPGPRLICATRAERTLAHRLTTVRIRYVM